MNRSTYRQVLACASPLALSKLVRGRKSGRGLPQSKTLARQRPPPRSSWTQCFCRGERRHSMNRSAELQFRQIRRAKDTLISPGWSPALQFRGSWSQSMRKSDRRLSMNRNVGQASRLPPSATPTERNDSRWRALRAGGTPALRWARCGSRSRCMRKSERRLSLSGNLHTTAPLLGPRCSQAGRPARAHFSPAPGFSALLPGDRGRAVLRSISGCSPCWSGWPCQPPSS